MVEPDMKTVSGTWAQLPRYSMEPSGSAMGDHAWWRDGGRGREGGGGGFVGARKKKKKWRQRPTSGATRITICWL